MITFEDKEDIRSSNLPRKNRITADDINQLKAHANRAQVFEAIINYSSIQVVAVNDIGDVTLSNPNVGVVRLTFPSGTFNDRIAITQFTNGEPSSIYRLQYQEVSGDDLELFFTDLSGTPDTGVTSASISIKLYPSS